MDNRCVLNFPAKLIQLFTIDWYGGMLCAHCVQLDPDRYPQLPLVTVIINMYYDHFIWLFMVAVRSLSALINVLMGHSHGLSILYTIFKCI